MRLHCLDAETEDVSTLFACAALRNELNDLALPRRENGWASACSIGVKQDFRHLVGEEGFMGGNGLDGPDQVIGCIGLQEITTRSRCEELIDQHFAVMHCEDENFSGCKTTVELARHFDAIDYWKGVIMTATSGRVSMALAIACLPSAASATTTQFGWASRMLRIPKRTIS